MKMFFAVNYLLVILCLLYGTTTSAQTATSCTLKGIEIHAKNTVSVGNSNDSIRYIINTPTKERKPVVLFIQGSGNRSLLTYDDTSPICYFTGSPFNWTSLKDQFYFVFISKPAIPLRQKYSEVNSVYDTTITTYREFTLNDTKDLFINN